MYIFEKLWEYLFPEKLDKEYNYDPLRTFDEDDEDSCEHEFLPVDSTGEVLACIKCGYVIRVNKSQDNMNDSNDASDTDGNPFA